MKRSLKKLSLSRETLRSLEEGQLKTVGGAASQVDCSFIVTGCATKHVDCSFIVTGVRLRVPGDLHDHRLSLLQRLPPPAALPGVTLHSRTCRDTTRGMAFPETRLRRFRRTPELRRLVRETRLSPDNLALPLFVVPGEGINRAVSSMPGVFQQSVDQIVATARQALAEGVRTVILFGLPESKDATGSSSWSPDGVVQRALRALAAEVPGLVKVVDVCFCEYTDHGHCGVLDGEQVDNDATLANLAKQAVSLAEAGADIIAPSDMMDGRVGAIRKALDGGGFADLPILSYAVKFASGFYGPFREAAESALIGGSATAAPTRWTPPTAARRCARRRSTSRRGRTC